MCIVGRIPARAVCSACGHEERFDPLAPPWHLEVPPRHDLVADAYEWQATNERLEEMRKVEAFLARNPAAGSTLLVSMCRTVLREVDLRSKGEPVLVELFPEIWDLVPHEDNRLVLRYLNDHWISSRDRFDQRLRSTSERVAELRAAAEEVRCEACGRAALRFFGRE